MILSMPADFVLETFSLEGKLLATGPNEFEWTYQEVSVSIWFDFDNWQVVIPDETPQVMIDILIIALDGWEQEPPWNPAARIILNLAQSAVGVDIRDLTDGQRWALLAVLMWDKRAIANDLTVRPLQDWVARKPDAPS